MPEILILDDNPSILDYIKGILKDKNLTLFTFESAIKAVDSLYEREYDLIVTDLFMPEIDGFKFISEVRQINEDVPIIMITGMGGVEEAVEAIKNGANDFLIKPFPNEEFIVKIEKHLEFYSMKKELRFLKNSIYKNDNSNLLVGESSSIKKLYQQVRQIAGSNASVLITGESGTGKELLARMIHLKSNRKEKNFIPVDCSTLSEEIIESELFGYRKGAFTGADKNRRGILEEANGGTVFFDEIGNMTSRTQSKLLRFLQEKEIKPVGSNNIIKVDVRILSATNADLRSEVINGRFREDLFYRISGIEMNIPPLRERPYDIPILIKHFIKKYSLQNSKNIEFIENDALKILKDRNWSGNVRELENIIEHAVIVENKKNISKNTILEILPKKNSKYLLPEENESSEINLSKAVAEFEKNHIIKILDKNNNNKVKTAKMLGVSRSVLYDKIDKYGI